LSNADKEAVGFIPTQELAILTYHSWDLRRDVLASEEDGLGKYILTSLSSTSSTSSIFTEDHLGSISRGEGDGDSK